MRLLCLLLLFSQWLPGQTEAWSGIGFEHEVSPDWGYLIDVEHRRALTGDPQGKFLLLLAGNRPLAEDLSLTFGARFTPAANGSSSVLRLFSDLNYDFPLGSGPFTLEGRLRYQQDRPPGENGNRRRVALRPRIGLATELSARFTLVTEYEGRFRFDRRNEWSRVRYTAGLEYSFSESLNLEIFGRREERINQASSRETVIFGLYAEYTLPDRRQRDWSYRYPFGRQVTW